MKNAVLIVGAGKGLSSSLAKIFYSNGYKIGLVARNINKIKYKKLLILQTARSLRKNEDIEELKINIKYIKNFIE